MSSIHLIWPKPSCKAQWTGEEDKADKRRDERTTSGNGHVRSSPSPRGQWRTRKHGGNWVWNHLWRPNNPRGQMIDDGDTWCLLLKWLWYYACSCGLSVSQRQMWWLVRQLHTLERNFSVTSSGAFEFVSVCVQTTPTSMDTISASDPRDLHKIQNWGESIALIITPICHCRHHLSHYHLLHYCYQRQHQKYVFN